MLVVILVLISASVCLARGRREPSTSTPTTTPTPSPSPPPEQERLYQTDVSIGYQLTERIDGNDVVVNGMKKCGCKFMSALGIAQTHAGRNLSAAQINSIRETAQSQGIIGQDMTTDHPAPVINMAFAALGSRLNAKVLQRVITLDRVYYDFDSTIVLGITVNGNQHFCEGDGEGTVIYNPYPTATYREIIGYILIRIIGYPTTGHLRSVVDVQSGSQ